MQKVTLDDLKTMAINARGDINFLYLHWSAGHYGQFFEDYHISIDADGSVYVSTDDLTEVKSHTWRHNTGAIGITLACCAFATTDDLGEEPPTEEQVEAMAQVIGVLCKYLQLPCDFDHVRTHGEQGDCEPDPDDRYGQNTTCERWDLAILQDGDEWGTGGNVLRGKANYYITSGSLP